MKIFKILYSKYMENCEAMRTSTHSIAYNHIDCSRFFFDNYQNSKFLYLPYFLSDLHQIFTVLFEIFYSFYWINLNLDRISPLINAVDPIELFHVTSCCPPTWPLLLQRKSILIHASIFYIIVHNGFSLNYSIRGSSAWCAWLPWISRSVCAIQCHVGVQHDVSENALFADPKCDTAWIWWHTEGNTMSELSSENMMLKLTLCWIICTK